MLQKFSIFNTIFNDAPQPWQLSFQDSAYMQCYLILIIIYTIFWNILIANYSNLYIIIELLEKINWIELSEEKIKIISNYLIISETTRMKYLLNLQSLLLFQKSTSLIIWGSSLGSSLGTPK